MGSKSNYLENKVLNHVLGTQAMTMPFPGNPDPGVYIGLYNVAPTDAGGGTEVSGGNYSRVLTPFKLAVGDGTTSNDGIVTFPTANADWNDGGGNNTILAFGVFDAFTTGNLLYWGTVSPAKTVLNGDTASFADGALVITEA